MKMYPLKFKPIYRDYLWGGHRLGEFFGKDVPAGTIIAESWEITDLPENKSVIANGPLAGKTIEDVLKAYPKEITGDSNFRGQFPLLIKILDANKALSVQVHPDIEACKRMGKGNVKTECWYIIDAKEGAAIYKGLKKGVTKEKFAQAIKNGTVEHLLNKIYVKKGECHFLPAGTAHAIGAGLLIAEIQTPSDTTYRVFDWNRVDSSGKSRPLHVEEALECIHFDQDENELTVNTIGRLVDCDFFKIDKGHQAENCEVLLSEGKMKVFMFLSGKGTISSESSEILEFKAGDTILKPAQYAGVIKFTADSEYLTISL